VTTRAHFVVLLVTVGTVLFILWLVRLRQLRSKYALLWLTIGLLLLPLAAFPGTLETVSRWFGIFYAPTAFLFLATGFLFVVVIQLTWELSRIETRMRTLAEEIALIRLALESRDGDAADAAASPKAASPPR
jgi:hypothetical protein